MKLFIALVTLTSLWTTNAFAYVSCKNVAVKIQTATGAGFHLFSEVGITGSILFIYLPTNKCSDSTGEELSKPLYLVIDDMNNATGIKKVWTSMLLSAEARGKTIGFHATNLGKNSGGLQVLRPYHIRSN